MVKAANGVWHPYEPFNPKIPFRRDHGVCGDSKFDTAPRPHEAGGKWGYPKSPIVTQYRKGETVEFIVDITTNHNGWFEFIICDADKCGGDINEKCFKDGHCQLLMREKTPECESEQSKECAPVDEKYPGRWYIPCRKGDHVGEHFMGGPFMRYKLPAGFQSNHAVIQFYWVTANSCNPPGFIDYFKRYPMKIWGQCPGDGGAFGGRNPGLSDCGGATFPEEFWGCADVSVGATGPPLINAPQLPPEPATNAATPPTMSPTPAATTPTPSATTQTPSAITPTPTPSASYVPKMNATPSAGKGGSSAPMSTPEAKMEVDEEDKDVLVVRKGVGKKMVNGEMKECVISFEQCDGKFHKGPKNCCNEKFYCHKINQYYSQCRRK